jgi:ribosomal protein S6
LETDVKNLYEGMFLVDSAEAASDWEGVIAEVNRILEKSEAEIVSIRKWDERALAYDVNGKSRGTYILCYFKVEGPKVGVIERDVQLSEKIMRVLILCGEHFTQEDIEKDTPATAVEKEREKRVREVASTDNKSKKTVDNEEPSEPDKELVVNSVGHGESVEDEQEIEKKQEEAVQEETVEE